MRLVRNPSLVLGPSGPNSRRHGRVRCVGLRCFFGEKECQEAEVLDLSASGMRIRMLKAQDLEAGSILRVVVTSDTESVELPVKVIWSKRKGYKRFELGVTFGEPGEKLRNILRNVMHAAADSYIIYDSRRTA
jgi:hypothetical protein